MARKCSQMVVDKKEALRKDMVEVKRSDFCFPNKKVNKAFMYMSEDCRECRAQDASITVDYYNDNKRVVRCVMQPCGDVYVTNYDDKEKAERTVCVNPNHKEGILLTEYDMKNLSSSDERTRFAKRVCSQSMELWKGYVAGKYLTGKEVARLVAQRNNGKRL